ncbi:amidohydrolase [Thermomicrobiaceae bacterium CFH 74404]|uniref:Amidohydrolase n=1 Tax=Thermalbibacter longus TaxID=2951981 RepID=A0AA41WE76_9BACT|nr:amidohydrolase family protein [Thermalbibacter longus]MCM8747831.1 amidohydrolase [Thermalbibacter longus]
MIDVHAHFIPPAVLDWVRQHADALDARWEQRDPSKAPFLTVGGKWSFELKPAFHDADLFLADQQRAGVRHSLVSPVPQLFLYDAHPALTTELARLYNNELAAWCEEQADRLSGLATLPLNVPEDAAAELSRARERGMLGAIIGPGCGDRLLSDPSFAPLWETADRLEAVLFLHPLLSQDPRLRRPQMPNLIGVLWETTVSLADLILSGLLDRYPRVKLLVAHGGGFLPYQIGRLDQGYQVWPAVRSALDSPPSACLRRLWFDSVVWTRQSLQLLLDLVGPERVAPGSDYPFDLSVWPPIGEGARGAETLLGRAP